MVLNFQRRLEKIKLTLLGFMFHRCCSFDFHHQGLNLTFHKRRGGFDIKEEKVQSLLQKFDSSKIPNCAIGLYSTGDANCSFSVTTSFNSFIMVPIRISLYVGQRWTKNYPFRFLVLIFKSLKMLKGISFCLLLLLGYSNSCFSVKTNPTSFIRFSINKNSIRRNLTVKNVIHFIICVGVLMLWKNQRTAISSDFFV